MSMWIEILLPVAAAVLGYLARHFKVPVPLLPHPAPAPAPTPGPTPTPTPSPAPSPSLIDEILAALLAALKAKFPNLPFQANEQGKVQLFEEDGSTPDYSAVAGPFILEVFHRVRRKDEAPV